METIANVVLGSGVVLLGIALIIALRSLSNVSPTLVSYGKSMVDSIKNQVSAENERDEWKTRAIKLQADLNLATTQLTKTTAELARQLEDDSAEEAQEVKNAPNPAAALDKFNELLQDVPNVPSGTTPAKTGP